MCDFTMQELQNLMNMLDLATKAGGLAVAENAVSLAKKLQDCAQKLTDKEAGDK